MSKKKQMSPEELAEYRKLQCEMLQEYTAEILDDLKAREASGEAMDANTPLGNTRGLLGGVLSCLIEGEVDSAIKWAKEACESLIDRATRAAAEGSPELADALRDHVNKLSPVVADMLPSVESDD